jgi:hypothetical protein
MTEQMHPIHAFSLCQENRPPADERDMFTKATDIRVRATRTPTWELDDDWAWPDERTDVEAFHRALIDASRPRQKTAVLARK